MVAVPKPQKSKKIKKPKPTSITHWKQLLDELWRVCVHVRDRSTDQYTLMVEKRKCLGSDAHHIFSRKCANTRWTVKNGILLKAFHNKSDAHVLPEKFRRTLIEKGWMTQSEYDALYNISTTIVHFKQPDYEQIKVELLELLTIFVRANPDYKPWVKERIDTVWKKRVWPITQEERDSIFD